VSKSKKTLKAKNPFYPLVQNDLIEIIAPGSSAPLENLVKGAEVLRSWGFQVQYDENILNPEMYLANSDKYRFEAFKKAMTNPKVKAVWCLRGGYGAIRLLPMIEKMPIPKKEKLLIGFSDVTSLHNLINRKWKWPSLHASLIDRLGTGKLSPENIKELQSSLFDSNHVSTYENLIPLNETAKKKKVIKSEIIGGNLVVLSSSIGTASQLKTKGKILFLEEIAERAYRIDRLLHQMKQAKMFEGVSAVVFGDFVNCQEADGKDYVQPTLENFFRDLKVPVFKGMQAGHGEIQRPVFFNTQTVLTCGSTAQMLNYGPK
jgi:muramoyltetrapeptide carboxypeptidase